MSHVAALSIVDTRVQSTFLKSGSGQMASRSVAVVLQKANHLFGHLYKEFGPRQYVGLLNCQQKSFEDVTYIHNTHMGDASCTSIEFHMI